MKVKIVSSFQSCTHSLLFSKIFVVGEWRKQADALTFTWLLACVCLRTGNPSSSCVISYTSNYLQTFIIIDWVQVLREFVFSLIVFSDGKRWIKNPPLSNADLTQKVLLGFPFHYDSIYTHSHNENFCLGMSQITITTLTALTSNNNHNQ